MDALRSSDKIRLAFCHRLEELDKSAHEVAMHWGLDPNTVKRDLKGTQSLNSAYVSVLADALGMRMVPLA